MATLSGSITSSAELGTARSDASLAPSVQLLPPRPWCMNRIRCHPIDVRYEGFLVWLLACLLLPPNMYSDTPSTSTTCAPSLCSFDGALSPESLLASCDCSSGMRPRTPLARLLPLLWLASSSTVRARSHNPLTRRQGRAGLSPDRADLRRADAHLSR